MSCESLQQQLASLQALQASFESAYDEAIKTGNISEALKLKSEIEIKLENLKKELFSFEKPLNLQKQYAKQLEILKNTGILEKFNSPPPSLPEINKRLQEKKELISRKIEQGFTKLLLVPFGLDLNTLIQTYGELLKQHAKNKTLLDRDGNTLELNNEKPVWVWDQLQKSIDGNSLIYFPKEYTANHGGQTKQEVIARQGSWQILLLEEDPVIPRVGAGQTIKDRPQLEANKTPIEYLNLLKTDPYKGESGLTPEDWFTYAIMNLEEKNQVIDDWRNNKDSISYLLGSYFASGGVPRAFWRRFDKRADLYAWRPDNHDGDVGARPVVRI